MGHDSLPAPASQFLGYPQLHYTPIPDLLFDELLPDLSGAELKVLLYIFRHTWGWKKNHDDISLSQMVKGIVKRDGGRLDRGAGVSEASALRALASLEKRGLILARRNSSPERGNLTTTYTVPIQGETLTPSHHSEGRRLSDHGEPGPSEVGTQETPGSRDIDEQEAEARIDKPPRVRVRQYAATIRGYVDDFAREFHDHAALPFSVGRALNLYRESGASLEVFVQAMYSAREATKANGQHMDSPMAYWFAVLEDRLRG